MRPAVVVEEEPCAQPLNAGKHILVILGIDLLVFDRTPESLDEDVVESSALSIHADAHIRLLEHAGKLPAGELGTLIRIEDPGFSHAQSPFQGLHAEVHIHRDRNGPGKDIAAEPVHDGHQVDKPTA